MSHDPDINRLIRESWAGDDPTGWFERVYAAASAGQGRIPWARQEPNPALVAWAERARLYGSGQRAVVIGCGLGDDAEYLAGRGFAVTAFDISPTAVDWCRRRFPGSAVDYRVADLFDLPPEWALAFDFVLEINTVQALPYTLSDTTTARIAGLVKPGGSLLVVCHGREPQQPRQGIPWPLSIAELAGFESAGLQAMSFDDFHTDRGIRRFRVHYRRPRSE